MGITSHKRSLLATVFLTVLLVALHCRVLTKHRKLTATSKWWANLQSLQWAANAIGHYTVTLLDQERFFHAF